MTKEIKFRAVPGSRYSQKDAAIVGPELKRIAEQNNGATPEQIVTEASSADSPLHKYFEWDDGKAASEYRLEQARHMERSVHYLEIVLAPNGEPKEQVVRYFHMVNVKPESLAPGEPTRRYLTIEQVQKDGDYIEQIIEGVRRELNAVVDRYARYLEHPAFNKRLGVAVKAIRSIPKAKERGIAANTRKKPRSSHKVVMASAK